VRMGCATGGTSARRHFAGMPTRSLHARGAGKLELRLSAIQRASGCARGWFSSFAQDFTSRKKRAFSGRDARSLLCGDPTQQGAWR
jgi:hypothetical protein